MAEKTVRIRPVRVWDLPTITRMVFANMLGVDYRFTEMVSHPLNRGLAYISLPLYFLLSGQGYKALLGDRIIGCGYVHLRRKNGYVFNINVNRPYRRQGVGRRLMTHLETIIKANGRMWAALEVDNGNRPAQEMYAALGYRPYHPRLFYCHGKPAFQKIATNHAAVEQLPESAGRRLYEHYRQLELRQGDPWALAVVSDHDFGPRSYGAYCRCLRDGEEIGCGWTSASSERLAIRLFLAPRYWGDEVVAGLVEQLFEREDPEAEQIELYLGSSTHHEAAAPQLNEIGFQQRNQPRILMLKRLD